MKAIKFIKDVFYDLNVKISQSVRKKRGPSTLLMTEKNVRKNKRKLAIQKNIFIWSLLILPIINWLIFWLYANFNMILMAFQTPDGSSFTFQNFVSFWNDLTAPNSTIGVATRNTLLYFIMNNLIILPCGMLLSFFIYKKIWGYSIFRILFFLPSIIPGLVMATLFKEVIKPWGPLASLGIHFPETGLLANSTTATPTIIFYCIWTGLASNMLLMCGTMSRVPTEVLEAAKLDGCGPMREFCSLIIPLIFTTLSTMIIVNMTGLFIASGPILIMTGGAYDTQTLSFWIFINVYQGTAASGAYNIVSATGLVFTVLTVPLILFVRWATERIGTVEY